MLGMVQIKFQRLSNLFSLWRQEMENFLALYEGKPLVADKLPSQKPVTQSFDFFMCAWTS